jgi:hypothetical protein
VLRVELCGVSVFVEATVLLRDTVLEVTVLVGATLLGGRPR